MHYAPTPGVCVGDAGVYSAYTPGWGMGECMGLMVEDDMSSKEAREGILGAIRTVMGGEHTFPDPSMDVTGCMVASLEMGVKSVSWTMVNMELGKDTEFKDLAEWVQGGCHGPPEGLPLHLREFWRVRDKLRILEGGPVLEQRTVIPKNLRGQVLETLHSAHQRVVGMGGAGSLLARAMGRSGGDKSEMFTTRSAQWGTCTPMRGASWG